MTATPNNFQKIVFLLHLQEVRSLTAGMFSKTLLSVLCVYFPETPLVSFNSITLAISKHHPRYNTTLILHVVQGYTQRSAHISSIRGSSRMLLLNQILACLSDLQIVLSRKLAKPLPLENVILVRLGKLRVAVLSHLCHLKARKE